MGTGTSHGIPVIACDCPVCTSKNPKDMRNRCSVYITCPEAGGKTTGILIDTGPEFRIQALKYKVNSIRAVLLTHSHADHLNGLDDLRIFSHTKFSANCKSTSNPEKDYPETNGQGLPIYANSNTIADAKNRFDYIFKPTQEGGGKPKLCFIDNDCFSAENPLKVGSVTIIPVPMKHGELPVDGYLISCTGSDGKKYSVAYLTDCSFISEDSLNLIKSNAGILEHVVIDALREKKHSTHCNFDDALNYAQKLCAKHTWFTHICHDLSHEQIESYIKSHIGLYPALADVVKNGGSVEPAFDGLVISCGDL